MGRIIYYGGRGSRKPSGGYAVLLQHLAWLRAAGLNGCLLVEDDFAPTHEKPSPDLPLLRRADALTGDDVLVVPEPDLRPVAELRRAARLWICCQNHHFVFNTGDGADAWARLGVEGVLTTSATIQRYVRRHFPDLRSLEVPCAVDAAFTRWPDGAPGVPGTVAVMPRKRPFETRFVRFTLERRHPELSLRWIEIDQVPRDEAARRMTDAAVFLFLGRMEGLGLPGLEAMAMGKIVVGFGGGGVCDYATARNGYWSRPDDFDQIVDDLALAARLTASRSPAAAQMRQEALATARRYSETAAAQAVVAAWRAVLSG